ncbi:MAG: bifunctional folylpolyglutamate synthase/dihydrofolate synthase [Chitinophagaceae bacterium]|nr:bifunctional folylpolyglutamate synthase/dihydrofolate synthase [Chitinophagaceae bacterium]
MTYQQTLDYLVTKLPLFSKIGAAAYKKDITNTILLCEAAGNPQNKIKTIHIAGTNGKGSVSHMLAAIFQQSGYKTGLYTSPHLKDFRERIKVNGEFIEKDFVVSFVEKMKSISEEINPSFFELTVVMALQYFVEQKVDIAIIETGLGGRLDSTNVITPQLSVITNIGYDHMNILGDTLEKIAFEKAGIIKQNVPVVIGESLPGTKNIFLEKAKQCNAEIVFAEDKFFITNSVLKNNELLVEISEITTNKKEEYILDLNGIYQQKNLLTALAAVDELNKLGFNLEKENIKPALASVKNTTGLYGRWDVIHQEPMIALDVAHNEDGIKQLLHQVSLCNYKSLHIVFGIVKDKDADKILSLLPKNARYYFTKAQIPRALPEDELAEKANAFNLQGEKYAEVNEALHEAIKHADKNDLVVVCGSVFLVGEVDTKVSAVNYKS